MYINIFIILHLYKHSNTLIYYILKLISSMYLISF